MTTPTTTPLIHVLNKQSRKHADTIYYLDHGADVSRSIEAHEVQWQLLKLLSPVVILR